jgi:hypothetical protein
VLDKDGGTRTSRLSSVFFYTGSGLELKSMEKGKIVLPGTIFSPA